MEPTENKPTKALPKIIAFRKNATQYGGSYDGAFSDNGDITRFAPEIRNPQLNRDMFFLPRFMSNDGSPNIEMNNWLAHYLRFQPLVNNLISLHSTLPFSRFGLVGVKDKNTLDFYEGASENMMMFEKCIEMAFQYFGLGEVFPFFHWDTNKGVFSDITLLDPNRINVKGHYMLHSKDSRKNTELYEYIPDDILKQMVMSTNPNEQKLINDFLDPQIRSAVENNLTLMLNPFSTGAIRRKINSYDLRGTSILLNALKILMLEDKLREQQMAFAQANVNPYIIWKLGNEEMIPDSTQLEDFRNMVQSLGYDTQKNIVSHKFLELEIKGASGQFDHMTIEYEYIENQILTSLWASKAFTHNDNISLNSSTVQMRMLMARYLPIRNMFENLFYRKVFMPMALKHKFYKRSQAEMDHKIRVEPSKEDLPKKLDLPLFDWRHKQSLMDDPNVRNMLQQLNAIGKFPIKTITDSLDLDYEYTMRFVEKEYGTVWDNDLIEIRKAILQSAAQGKLTEPEESIKKVVEAVALWNKMVLHNGSYVEVKEEVTKEREKNLKKEEKKLTAAERKQRERDRDALVNAYEKEIAEQLDKDGYANKENFTPVFDNKALIVQSLKENKYPTYFIEAIKDQLYDLKISLAKESHRFVYKNEPIQDVLNHVLAVNQPMYLNRLIAVKEMSYKDEPIKLDPYIWKIERANIDVDSATKNEYWKQIYPELEKQTVANFVSVHKRAQLLNLKKAGKEEVKFNDKMIKTAELSNQLEFKITDTWTIEN